MSIRKRLSGLWLLVAAVALDQLTKRLMLRVSSGETIALLPGVLRLRRVSNTGMAFSLLSSSPALLTVMTGLIVAAAVAWLLLRPERQGRLLRCGLWLAAGGGLGNLIDRIAYGYVVDFIEPTFVRFAVFNVADIAVCVGVGLIALAILLEK